ncbi:MAG: PAS domain S-box protein [Candidatus Sumerlaeia bacterium]|nr:PAS domain S-box protein [Candidatus Sumerlaeia bacterium]
METGELRQRVHDLEDLLRRVERQESFLALAAEMARLGGWEWRFDAERPVWTREVFAIFGLPEGEVPKVEEVLAYFEEGESRDSHAAAVARARATGEGWDLQAVIVAANGERTRVRSIGRPIIEGGAAVGMVGAVQDVTAIFEIRSALHRSEELYRTVFTHHRDPVFLLCAEPEDEGRIVAANHAAGAMRGTSADELVGRMIGELDDESDRHLVSERFEALRRTGFGRFDVTHRLPDGSLRHFDAGATVILIGGKRYTLAVNRDITERRRTELALRESEARFRALADSAPVFIWLVDAEGAATYFNQRWIAFTGVPLEEQLGEGWSSVIHPDDHDEAQRVLMDAVRDRVPFTLRYRLWCAAAGAHRWIEESAVPRFSDSGEFLGVVGSAQDIHAQLEAERARQALEERTQQAQRLESLGVLAGGVAHDFNNLLAAILGNTELLEFELARAGMARSELLGEVVKATERARDLCSQLLAYAGRTTASRRRVDLAAMVRSMGALLGMSTGRRVPLEYDIAAGLPEVEGDPAQLQQIVLNLAVNASEACPPEGGVVRIAVRRRVVEAPGPPQVWPAKGLDPGEHVELEVTDNGCGMDAETLARVFDPFFTTKVTGRGLGLATVLGAVRGHGGGIAAESAPGAGTRFTVSLRAVEHSASAAEQAPAPSDSWRGEGAALVVDDEPPILATQVRLLESLGFSARGVTDGADALGILDDAPELYSLVVLDLSMPRMSGEQVYLSLRHLGIDTPVLIATGVPAPDLMRKYQGDRHLAWIEKPFLRRELGEKLRRLLGQPR